MLKNKKVMVDYNKSEKTTGVPNNPQGEMGVGAPTMRERDAYSLAEFCSRMGIGRTLGYSCLADGSLKSVLVRKRRLIPATECIAFLERLAMKGGAK